MSRLKICLEHYLIEHKGVCSVKLKPKVLRGKSVLATLFTPQIQEDDFDGKAGDIS